MIDPNNITNYNLNKPQLEEVLLFWVCAAGKTAKTAAKNLDSLLRSINGKTPFLAIKNTKDLPEKLKSYGIGCYNHKAKTFIQLANSELNLKSCSVDDLENIYGIGPKTARCFLIHSRPNMRFAGLDTHILKYLRGLGYEVPKTTPIGKKYKEIEQILLNLVDKSGKSVAEFDLEIWRKYSSDSRKKKQLK